MSWSRSLLAAGLLLAPVLVVGCNPDAGVAPEEKRTTGHALSGSSGSTSNAAAADAARGTNLTTTVDLELRQSPSRKATILRVMASGTVVESLGESQAGFLHVNVAGDDGWVLADALATAAEDAPAGDSSADGTDASANELCFRTVNQYRQQAGLAPLERWTEQESCSDGEAASDGSTGSAHGAFQSCGEVAQNECPGDPGDPADALPQCIQQMVDEGPGGGHYDNMMNPEYTKVACGISLVDGTIWAVQNFR